ncbi:MAG: hypothetical protein O3A33_04745 [Chloroflexi bacterium]|nr:hypothetical protein [Chloroflexota bacterium]
MSKLWWMYVTAFVAGIGITIMGMIQGEIAFVAIGVIIGVALYFSRGQIK